MTGCGCYDPVVFGHGSFCAAGLGCPATTAPSWAEGWNKHLESLSCAGIGTRDIPSRCIPRNGMWNRWLQAWNGGR